MEAGRSQQKIGGSIARILTGEGEGAANIIVGAAVRSELANLGAGAKAVRAMGPAEDIGACQVMSSWISGVDAPAPPSDRTR